MKDFSLQSKDVGKDKENSSCKQNIENHKEWAWTWVERSETMITRKVTMVMELVVIC